MAAGMHIVRPTAESVDAAVHDGYTLIALGVDSVFLGDKASEALEFARPGK
jgi:hypothetical protein